MKSVDLSGLIKGLMVVIGIAMALGKYDKLAAWARREAFGVHTKRHQGRSFLVDGSSKRAKRTSKDFE